jgi:hypothetical protein
MVSMMGILSGAMHLMVDVRQTGAGPGGDRQANCALWHIVITRLASDPDTQAYMERRVKEGRSKREVVRVLKRYVAREVYRALPRG